ncbi:MAG: M48 family metalloprotease [Aquabacterium sp.]|uniref:M48 family metalloprotease n=1 Tax=Aquabacterium sp. TaxID=1872578 RepID=UPI002A35FDA4|nr:M48 family metalloprotease [Aquabacterium sp.]MDX9842335.1 M48 family metalloprotease [Aquabacterium sp.]
MARAWVCGAALGLSTVSAHALVGYDPFPDAASIHASDELEERLWDEAELLRGQFVRGKPSPAVATMQRLVRGVLMKHWPELSRKVKVYVIDQADVLAFTSANGDIFLSTGMLLRLDSEEELQVILAREIAHFTHRHTARTVHAARLGAGAKVLASTALDAADLASKITTGVGMMDLAKSVASLSQEVLLTSGREILQDRLNKLKEILADSFFRSMSVTGIGMVVKSSIFGFKDSLEEESDEYAMAFIEQKQGSTEAYRRVMQRLYDEAVLDEKKFSVFYANEDRLADRLKALTEFEAGFESRRAARPPEVAPAPELGGAVAEQASAPLVAAASASVPASSSVAVAAEVTAAPMHAVAVAASAVASASPSASAETGTVQGAKPDVVVALPSSVVASVVPDEQGAGAPEPMPAPVTAVSGTVAAPVAEQLVYHQAIEPLVMPLLESELEAGRYKRLMRNIERTRSTFRLPDRARAVLAESYAATSEPALQERGQALAQELLSQQPEDARMWKLLGNLSYRRGQWAEAKDHLSKALKFAPEGDERGFIEQHLRQIDKKMSEVSK